MMGEEIKLSQEWLVRNTWGDWRTMPSLTWRLSTKHGSTGEKDSSDFENGVKIQAYLHYSFLSDQQKCALKIKI
jgi:hypothetical protein